MFKQQLIDHFVSAGLDPENMSKDSIDGYFAAVVDTEDTYLPDDTITSLDRAADTINRLAAENPDMSVALTRFEQVARTYTVASFVWDNYVRVDLLFPFAPSFEGTIWVTASSAANFIHNFMYSPDANSTVTAVQAPQPEWAENGFVLLIGLPPSGNKVVDGDVTYKEVTVPGETIQRAGASVYGHHTLHQYTITEDEKAALMILLGATFEKTTVPISMLLAVGAMNPFATNESLKLRAVEAGTVIIGGNAMVGPLVHLIPAEPETSN